MVGALAIPTLMRPARVAWREFQPSEGMFDVQMPAEPVKREPVVESAGGGITLTKNTYEASVKGQGSALYVIVEFSPALPLVETSIYEKALEAELTTLANNTHSTVRSKDKITVNGYHGLSYTLNPPKNLALDRPFSTGKIIINSNYLYVMHITASESSELREGMDKFLTPRALIELTSGK